MNTIEWVFLFSAFFFTYILKVVDHGLLKSKKYIWIYFPIVVSIIIHTIAHLEYNFSLIKIEFDGKVELYDLIFGLEEIGSYIFTITLLVWSYILIKKSTKKTGISLTWVKKLWLFICVLTSTWVLLFLVDLFLVDRYPQLDHYFLYDLYLLAIELSLFVYWVAYTGLYKLKIVSERKEILDILRRMSNESLKGDASKESKKTVGASNDFVENNIYFVQLERLLKEQFIYRDPDLSREVVAEKLGISTGYLSQIVNKVTQKKFTSYVNSFRVEEAKRLMLDAQFDKYSLLSIGLESGFKSKTTFYKSFKKETGFTPNEFKKQHK